MPRRTTAPTRQRSSCKDRPAGVGERFFRTRARAYRRVERKAMIDRDHALPLAHQAQLLELSRGSLYYVPVPISQADLELMREIDRLHTDYPFCGARMLRDMLSKRGYRIGRRHVGRLMRLMGIEALYRKTERHQDEPRALGLPLPSKKPRHRSARSRLVCRHLVHPHASRLPVPVRHP